MSDKEKEGAFLLLSEEFKKSSVAADALMYINKDEAYSIIKTKYDNDKKNGHINYHVAAMLFRYDSNEAYLKDFIFCCPSISELELAPYLDDASEIKHDETTNLLAVIVNSAAKQHIRRQAGIYLLERFFISEEKINPILMRLKSDNLVLRNNALNEVFSYTKR